VAPLTTRAILLRTHPYGETSLVLRFFTRELGTVGVMAKGVRSRGSKRGTGLETFASGDLILYVKETRDLQTFKDFTNVRQRRGIPRHLLKFAGASVVGELVYRHGGESASPALFDALESVLDRLEAAEEDAVVSTVLAAGWWLVANLGYHPVLDTCVRCGSELEDDTMGRFDFSAGGVRGPCCSGTPDGTGAVAGPRVGPGARAQLAMLVEGAPGPVTRPRAHAQLLSDFVTYHVSGTKPLESFRFLLGLLPADSASEGG
jgi:DNA repair protein RecO (recombination protein O)